MFVSGIGKYEEQKEETLLRQDVAPLARLAT